MNEQVAQSSAILEVFFDKIAKYFQENNVIFGPDGFDLGEVDERLRGYTLLEPPKEIRTNEVTETGEYTGTKSPKCLAVKDCDDNIIVHFQGTGDGNWEYNAENYGPNDSLIQTESTEYLKSVIDKYKDKYKSKNMNTGADFYVTGHSQGGNTAQYATLAIAPEYGQYIVQTISLDGPGMSYEAVDRLKENYDYYQQQQDKLYAINGYRDFVSALGQVQVIPENHVYIMQTSDVGINTPNTDIANRGHASNFMIYEVDGKLYLCEFRPYDSPDNGESSFRKFVILFNQNVICDENLSREDQYMAAIITMRLIEHYLGKGDGTPGILGKDISIEDWEYYRIMLSKVLVKTIREDPELLQAVLQEPGLLSPGINGVPGESLLSPEIANFVATFIEGLNKLPLETEQDIIAALLSILVIGENGQVDLDISKLVGHIDDLAVALTVLVVTLMTTPEGHEMLTVLNNYLAAAINNWLREHLPGYATVMDQLHAIMEQRNLHSFKELMDYIATDPLANTLDILISLISNPETLGALLAMGATLTLVITLAVVLMPLIIAVLGVAAKIVAALAAITVALAALKIALDFLVETGKKIIAAINAGIEFIAELSRNIYERITQGISTFIQAALDTAARIYNSVISGLKKAAEAVSVFGSYVFSFIAKPGAMFVSIACCISRAVTGQSQQEVRINEPLLNSTVDDMNRLANRVQAIDRRLDSLYNLLTVNGIEEGEGIWTSLANLYNLAKADISVDEGNRIRRMANNLSGLYTGYSNAERWVLQQL